MTFVFCVLMVYCVLNNNAFKLFLKGHSVILVTVSFVSH